MVEDPPMAFFWILALIGFALSLIVHGLTFVGVDPLQHFPYVWVLHIGIFVVWIPAVWISKQTKTSWKSLTKPFPFWMKPLPGILFAYMFFNFFFTIFVLQKGGSPSMINGEKVLQSHHKIIKKLSEEEYHLHQAYEVRTFSGHWLLFYGYAALMLDPKRGLLSQRKQLQSPV